MLPPLNPTWQIGVLLMYHIRIERMDDRGLLPLLVLSQMQHSTLLAFYIALTIRPHRGAFYQRATLALKWCRICFLRLPASSPTIPAEQGLFAYGIPSRTTLHGCKLHCSLGRSHPSSACHVRRTSKWSTRRDFNPR